MVRRRVDEPNMSDNLLLVKVEDLINMAVGLGDKNTVNYKLVQMVLHILARNLRMLETQVEVRISDEDVLSEKRRDDTTGGSKDPGMSPRGKVHMEGVEERGGKKDKHRANTERATSKEREKMAKEHDKDEKQLAKDKEKAEKAAAKEREKAEKMQQKESERADKAAAKERGKREKGTKGRGHGSGTSIAVSERERHKEKVLVGEY